MLAPREGTVLTLRGEVTPHIGQFKAITLSNSLHAKVSRLGVYREAVVVGHVENGVR